MITELNYHLSDSNCCTRRVNRHTISILLELNSMNLEIKYEDERDKDSLQFMNAYNLGVQTYHLVADQSMHQFFFLLKPVESFYFLQNHVCSLVLSHI